MYYIILFSSIFVSFFIGFALCAYLTMPIVKEHQLYLRSIEKLPERKKDEFRHVEY